MVYELEDTSKAKGLFEGWQETLILSCLQKVMGRIFVTDLSEPASAFAFVGCFVKHLALIACSALILRCLDEGLYPSWDAQNMASVRLAEKLGYQVDHEYAAYEVT